MNPSILIPLFERDLQKLITELKSYSHEAEIWSKPQGINNSAGNLALHLIGNLNHFIGAILGGTDYVRDREGEFSKQNIPLHKLVTDIESTIETIRQTLQKLTANQMEDTYPLEVFGKPLPTGYFLIHLSGHLSYHLGQVNYHLRLLPSV